MLFGGRMQADTGIDYKAQRARLPHDPNWSQMARGSFGEKYLPDEVQLPAAVAQGIDELYEASLKSGHYERGGNIVREYDGDYSVRPGGTNSDDVEKKQQAEAKKKGKEKPITPDKNSWEPDRDDVGWTENFVGHVHTHAYPEPGVTGTFSGPDISGLVTSDEKVSMLKTGADTEMLTSSKEFEARLEALESDDFDEQHEATMALQLEMNQCWERVFKATKGTHRERTEMATKALAKKYQLGYYSGQGRNLHRVK